MPTRSTFTGVLLMVFAMLTIPLVDGIAKHLNAVHSPLYVSWARYVVACCVVLPWALRAHGRQFLPRVQLGAHLLRTVLLVGGMTCYFIAIASVPLVSAASAYFVGPIIAMLLAVLVLGEVLTARKILALVLGFAGTLIVLQPAAGIEPGLLWALASGVCIACYLVATRHAVQHSTPLQTLAFQCLIGALLLTPQALWTWSVPQWPQLLSFAALGGLSVLSHMLSITALRHAEASVLAPLVYVELLGTVAVGYFAFREVPGAQVWAGAAAIIAGGLLLLRSSSNPLQHE